MDARERNRRAAIKRAAKAEKVTGKPMYVVWCAMDGEYQVFDRMPLLGEWYTADGLRQMKWS